MIPKGYSLWIGLRSYYLASPTPGSNSDACECYRLDNGATYNGMHCYIVDVGTNFAGGIKYSGGSNYMYSWSHPNDEIGFVKGVRPVIELKGENLRLTSSDDLNCIYFSNNG